MSLEPVIDQLRDYLEFERDENRGQAPVSPETLRALREAAQSLREAPGGEGASDQPPVELDLMLDKKNAPSGGGRNATRSPVEEALRELAAEIAVCERCGLCQSRTQTVPGQGSPRPDIMFVGEGPGAEEDRQGVAFIGKAGQLLTRMIVAMGYTRDEVFIGNVVKCRPPNNRTPALPEMEACMPYLRAQIRLLEPRVIIALGGTALKGLLDQQEASITRMRGQWRRFEGIRMMPTFHPAYLLRQPSEKRAAWADLQAVLRYLGRPIPPINRQR